MEQHLVIGLNIALTALIDSEPHVLCVKRPGGWGLPFGRFNPNEHRTFELALRDFVERQTAVTLGYVEQLYTFGDRGREAPRASLVSGDEADRIVSVGYLALAGSAVEPSLASAAWRRWYDFFPWEDQRGEGSDLRRQLTDQLTIWAAGEPSRLARLALTFSDPQGNWEEERALDRYELMHEARLVTEALRDRDDTDGPELHGDPMISDHRRILATAIGRLRGKLRYRPVIFNLLHDRFTLSALQSSVEAVLGFSVHKQNFRRSVESGKFVMRTDQTENSTGGRPAALYRPGPMADSRSAAGLALPRLRLSTGGDD